VSWSGDEIVFGQASKGIMRVSANGGEPEVLVAAKDDEVLQGPQVVPGRRAVLFSVAASVKDPLGPKGDVWDKANVVVQSLESGERKTLIKGGSHARYVPTGHLVYAVAGTLRSVPFDAARLEVLGDPVPVVEGVARSRYGPNTVTGSAHFSVSETGTLVYLPGPVAPSSSPLQDLALLDRNRNVELLKLSPAMYEFPRISPDGKQVAVGVDDGQAANVWIYDLSGTTSIRQLTFGGRNQFPAWSHDGQYVAFQSDREGDLAIFRQRADGSQQAERLTKPEQGTSQVPDSWSPDGRHLLYEVNSESTFSLWVFSVQDLKGAPFAGVQSSSVPPAAAFSPDGRWVAYQSDEIPNPTIFVQQFPGPGVPQRIVRGRHPQWSADGKQLFYTTEDRIFAVKVSTRPGFTFTAPTFVTRGFTNAKMPRNYDVSSDGSRFLGVTDAAGQSSLRTTAVRRGEVVLNWFEELKRLVPTK
jgi:WD40-like Beta Propeller Repeat